ncbi:MAG: diaminopimelate decarboxylase [Bifidobacteriaceae bacterium]|jgi:diaminopimelate decarboxylase|nr:diaminopimelate decarboxylase [Bifidobacteriaceae bacterium]
MPTHEAGALHAQLQAPAWLEVPRDVNALLRPLWPRTAFKADDAVLQVGGIAAPELARQVGTPAYIVDEADFRGRALEFKNAFEAAFAPLGGARVHYAAKALITIGVAGWLAQDGLALDVCSEGELEIALRAGVAPELITAHGSNKPDAYLARALAAGAGRIVVDSLPEIDQVARLARAGGSGPAPVMLRCSIGIEAHTHEFIATSHEDQKFGLSAADGSVLEAARRVAAAPELALLGLHSHIGSQIFDVAAFAQAIERLGGLTARVEADLAASLPELGLGGGFGVAYTTGHDPMPVPRVARGMADLVGRVCGRYGIAPPHVTVEPGRAIAGPAGITLYTVGVVKPVALAGGLSRLYVSVDGGMSDNIRAALYGADYSATLASRRSQAPPRLARVVGIHCESGDIVVKDEYLPADIAPGDLLAVPVTGAYCHSMASNYNQTPRPPVVAVRDGLAAVLVRRETAADLLARDLYA